MEIIKNKFKIGACKKNCNERGCANRSYAMCRELNLQHCSGRNKLFVRHARYDKNGRKYSYGDWYCAIKIIEEKSDFFSSSEKKWMEKTINCFS